MTSNQGRMDGGHAAGTFLLNMRPSARCVELIKSFETLQLVAYRPTPNDVWTLGYGHTRGVKEGDTCTEPQALDWLRVDMAWAAQEVNFYCKVPLTQNQFDALVSIVFNIGAGNFEHSTLLVDMNRQDIDGAEHQFLVWDKQRGVRLAGLMRRRAAELALFSAPPESAVHHVAALNAPLNPIGAAG